MNVELNNIDKRPTNAQLIFLNTIYDLWEKTGWYPSQREVGRTLHMNSSATSVGYVTKLEELGLVKWHRTSGIKLTDEGLYEVCRWREMKKDPDCLDSNGVFVSDFHRSEINKKAQYLFDVYCITEARKYIDKLKVMCRQITEY